MKWITPEAVAAYMGIPMPDGDDAHRLTTSTDAAAAYVERVRSDLVDEKGAFQPSEDVRQGSIMFAAHIYQQRSAPGGFAAWGDGMGDFTPSVLPSLVQRLIGVKRPVIG